MTTAEAAPPQAHEQTRARYPDETGFIERDGVHVPMPLTHELRGG